MRKVQFFICNGHFKFEFNVIPSKGLRGDRKVGKQFALFALFHINFLPLFAHLSLPLVKHVHIFVLLKKTRSKVQITKVNLENKFILL